MKIIKLKTIINNKLKRYFLYAIGELCLIVLGILVALYLKNINANIQYEKQIDSNFLRVYSELEKNIEETKGTIENIRKKDSLIYLVMNDSIEAKRYYNDINLAYLILYFHNLNIEKQAYQNLISLNISDNKYKNEILLDLKELYSITEGIKRTNDRMSSFVYNQSLPLLAQNTKSFGALTYKGQVKKDVVDYLTTSKEYKSYVSLYAIIAIKNQLRYDRYFLKKALGVYSQISDEYNLRNKFVKARNTSFSQHIGLYVNTQHKDTLRVRLVHDSLLLYRDTDFNVSLVPITNHSYIIDKDRSRFFVCFFKNENKNAVTMKINQLSTRYLYEKIE